MARSENPESALFPESGLSGDDALAALEERIRLTVELVRTLRAERDAAIAERDAARHTSGSTAAGTQKLRDELENLRSERKHVRTRIEKLLGQMGLLSGQ
jgi:FtsZ-binding cell division protein ZapB